MYSILHVYGGTIDKIIFILFGLYALEGNYDHLPEDSSQLDDYEAKPL